MSIFPILVDSALPYMGATAAASSLLLLPAGHRPIVAELAERVGAITSAPPIVLLTFSPDAEYERALRAACPAVEEFLTPAQFRDRLHRFDPSDALLIVAPNNYPAEGIDLRMLAGGHLLDSRMARHLLAFETSSLHTKELVHSEDGRVRRIQRYFEPVTWPFPAAVIASLVPVACLVSAPELSLASPAELRRTLAARGTPSHDVPFHGHFFDLTDEGGALGFCERRVFELTATAPRRSPAAADSGVFARRADVHPTARLLGPIVALDGVVVEAGALVIGPTLLDVGARIGAGAVVAQCLVAADTAVPAGATMRHRVIAARPGARADGAHRAPVLHRLTPSGASLVGMTPAARPQRRQLPTPPRAPVVLRGVVGYDTLKRVVEPLLALVALILLAPVLLAIAVLVAVTSGRPILYGDAREGKDGRSFRCLKFRSMRTNADIMQRTLAAQQQMDGPQFKMDRDPRVTPVGHWLRRLNVDELPQLLNVVRGEMSFVGPRPSPFRENQICVPWRQGRLSVRPGITGLWQVCRHDRANGDFHQWIHYDLLYVRHLTFRLDVKILAATILTLGGRRPVSLSRMVGEQVAPPRPETRRSGSVAVPTTSRTRRHRTPVPISR